MTIEKLAQAVPGAAASTNGPANSRSLEGLGVCPSISRCSPFGGSLSLF